MDFVGFQGDQRRAPVSAPRTGTRVAQRLSVIDLTALFGLSVVFVAEHEVPDLAADVVITFSKVVSRASHASCRVLYCSLAHCRAACKISASARARSGCCRSAFIASAFWQVGRPWGSQRKPTIIIEAPFIDGAAVRRHFVPWASTTNNNTILRQPLGANTKHKPCPTAE